MQGFFQNILIYVVNAVSIIVIFFALYSEVKRYKNINELPTTVISKSIKEKNLKNLTQSKYILSTLGVLNLINLLLPNGLIKFVIPAISIVVSTNILISLFEEIDTFNVSKGDVDLISDFKQKQRKEALEKAKKRAMQNKKDK